jgi:hypothetical protein
MLPFLLKVKKIAKGFEEKSEVGFSNCAICVDGLLIWTHKPSEKGVKKAGVGRKKFLCGQRVSLILTVRQSPMIAGGYWISQLFTVERLQIAWHLKVMKYLHS